MYKAEWDAAIKATEEAENDMLSKTETWLEGMKAVVDNERDEHNKIVDAEVEVQMSAAEKQVAEMFMEDNDDDEADLPF